MFNFFKKLSKKKYKNYECVKNDENVIKHEMKGCEEISSLGNKVLLQLRCVQTVVLEKTPESLLDSKEIKPVNLKGDQP